MPFRKPGSVLETSALSCTSCKAMRLEEESSTGSQPTSIPYRLFIFKSHTTTKQQTSEFNGLFYFLRSFLATSDHVKVFTYIQSHLSNFLVLSKYTFFFFPPQEKKRWWIVVLFQTGKKNLFASVFFFFFKSKAKVYMAHHGHRTLTSVQSVRHNIWGKPGEIQSLTLNCKWNFFFLHLRG